MPWSKLNMPMFPWVASLCKIMSLHKLPIVSGPDVMIFSDYGGSHKSCQYRVNAYLYVDLEKSIAWEVARKEIRAAFLSDGRRMSYKGLSDQQRARAIVPFLEAALNIQGLCLVTITNKRIRHLCSMDRNEHYGKFRQVANLAAKWKQAELEEAIRISHVAACLVGGLSKPDQDITWISDEDNIFGNMELSRDVGNMFSKFCSHYVKHSLQPLKIGTTKIDEGDRFEEDFASVADLVAGGLSEMVTRLSTMCGGRISPHLAVEYARELPEKVDLITNWFWHPGGNLKRLAVLFEDQTDGQYSVSKLEMV
jgi:hypothetical protein